MSGSWVRPLPADDLIARCRRVYAECETYADEGEQRTTYFPVDVSVPSHWNLRRFRTRWRRPDRFLFEFRSSHFGDDPDDLYAIWTAADGVRSWWTVQPTTRTSTALRDALGMAAGVSGGTSCDIPDLLLPHPGQHTLPEALGFAGRSMRACGASRSAWSSSIPLGLGRRNASGSMP